MVTPERTQQPWYGRLPWIRPRDPKALRKLLAEEPPANATTFPLRVRFGYGGVVGALVVLLVPSLAFLALHWLLGLDLKFGLVIAGAGIIAGFLSSAPDFTNLNQAMSISGEGIRLEKAHRTYTVPWWQVVTMEASPDLLTVRVIGHKNRVTVDLQTITADKRIAIAQALRAHGKDHGLELAEWPGSNLTMRSILKQSAHIVGGIVMIAGFYFSYSEATLGMRCSANGTYFQERFRTPARQGCVVLRVSAGAEKAGIRVGDLVIRLADYPVTSGRQFSTIFYQSSQPWEFDVIRKGEPGILHYTVEGGRGRDFEEDPTDPLFYYLQARWNAGHDATGAIRDYTRAIELEPAFDLAYLYRGQLYEETGQLDIARQDYETALELSPGLAEAQSIYAYFIDRQDWQSSWDHIQEAIRLDNCESAFETLNLDCATHYLQLASLHARQEPQSERDFELVIEAAEHAIRFYPQFVGPYYIAACAYSAGRNDYEGARQYARQYLDFPESERDPNESAYMEQMFLGWPFCSPRPG